MLMDNDHHRILAMLKEDQISLEEAVVLLEAAESKVAKNIVLTIKEKNRECAHINIPFNLAPAAWKFIPKDIVTEDINLQELLAVLQAGTGGTTIEIQANDYGRSVEISLQ